MICWTSYLKTRTDRLRCEDQGCSSCSDLGHLGCSDHEVVEFRVLRGRNRTINSILRKQTLICLGFYLEEMGKKDVCAIIQQGREKTERNLMKFSKEILLLLERNNPILQWRLRANHLENSFLVKGLG